MSLIHKVQIHLRVAHTFYLGCCFVVATYLTVYASNGQEWTERLRAATRARQSSWHVRHGTSDATIKGHAMDDCQTSGVDARACRQVSSARGQFRRRRRHAISHVNKPRLRLIAMLCH